MKLKHVISVHVIALILLSASVTFAEEAAPVVSRPVNGISGKIYEKHGGLVHGFLSVAEKYADNILYTPENEKRDLITLITPGIWLSLPGGKEEIPQTVTASSAPAGVVQSSLSSPSFRRLLMYASYTPEFEIYRKHTNENTESHLLEAGVRYRFRGDLSLGVLDQYDVSHDDRSSDHSRLLNTYKNNLFSVSAGYDVARDFSVEAGFSSFRVDYSAARNDFRDRRDTSADGTLSYHFTSKTSVFWEYEWVDISYDEAGLDDSREQNLLVGLRWDFTGKSAGIVRAGWGVKQFDSAIRGDEGAFRMDIQVEHHFTGDTGIVLDAYQRTEETNLLSADYRMSRGVNLAYTQKIRSWLQISLGGAFVSDTYEGGALSNPRERRYTLNAGAVYAFRKWFTCGVEYTFSRQDSDFAMNDYRSNEVVFRVTVSL